MTDKIDTASDALDRRVTFQDETPKTSDCVLCLYCGGSLHNPEHGIFWEQTTGHYCAEQQITDLQKKLDKQVGYKEDYRVSYMGAMDDLHQAEARFIEQRDSLVSVTKKLAKTEAKLAKVIKKWLAAESEAYDLRAALTPPADLVQQATKGNTSD